MERTSLILFGGTYVPPTLEILPVEVERGFEISDFKDGGEMPD